MDEDRDVVTRRALIGGSALCAVGLACGTYATRETAPLRTTGLTASGPVAPLHALPASDVAGSAGVRIVGPQPRPALLRRALVALERHGDRGVSRDRIAVVDFAMPSSRPRLHVVDLRSGRSWATLVSHGSGSDPQRTGWVERLSNMEGSNASCEGAFLTSDFYEGRHGRSQRLIGLDPSNDRALERAIVIHGAWYSERAVAVRTGALGRSQGCFAVGDSVLDEFLGRLGRHRMVFASKA